MEQALFLVGAVLVTIFSPQMVFCYYEDDGVNFNAKEIIDSDTSGLQVQVHVKMPTISEAIRGSDGEETFNAVCMSVDKTPVSDEFKHEDVVLTVRKGQTRETMDNIGWRVELLTCYVPQTIYGFHQVKRLYTVEKQVNYVVNNSINGEIKADKFPFKRNGKSITGAMVTVTTYSPYMKFDENYLNFKGQYKLLDLKDEKSNTGTATLSVVE